MAKSPLYLLRPKYRPDIDGLRAIAVLSIVTFHALPNFLRSGFVGVDVFFVISGFLISRILFENLERGTFRFSDFYARRIRRIFPALSLVLGASSAFGWIALRADEYKQLGKHIAAGAGFISNLVFWSEAGYFDNSAETKPLLHLWSLGIEEQFYIAWPLLLWVAWKQEFSLLKVGLLVAFVSFLLNIEGVGTNYVASFYSPQTRFWELLCGSVLAWFTLYKKGAYRTAGRDNHSPLAQAISAQESDEQSLTTSNVLSSLGMLVLAYGFWRIDKELSFPGWWALIPVLGTVLTILAGPQAWINRSVLSNRLAVWFGLISFPLYLWHCPLLSFARILEGQVPSAGIRVAAVVLSVLLAWLTYQIVEQPIREGRHGKIKAAFLVILMTLVGSFGYVTFIENGFEGRFLAAADHARFVPPAEPCENCRAVFPDWTTVTDNRCMWQKKSGNTLAIIGDSHAAHLYPGLSEMVGENGGIAVFPASCAAPYLDISTGTKDAATRKVRQGAFRLINSAYEFVLSDPNFKTVILAHAPFCSFNDVKDVANPAITSWNEALENGMRRTFLALRNAQKKAIVLFDNPELPYDPSTCLPRPFRLTAHSDKCSYPRAHFDSLNALSNYRALVNRVLKDFPEVRTYDLSKDLCDDQFCYLAHDGELLYQDRNHLNINGARYVAPSIMGTIHSAQ